MGASDFRAIAFGKTAEEAFRNAVDQHLYEYGHGGYTGTIAEKRGFKLITPPPRIGALKAAQWIASAEMDRQNANVPKKHLIWALHHAPVYGDKWGDALAAEIRGKKATELKNLHGYAGKRGVRVFVFFGLASE